MNTKAKAHKEICEYLNNLYERKNHDYGDSFHQTFVEEGMAMARIRLGDKFSRFKTLTLNGSQQVQDESVRDTLLDLANYAIMTVMEMDLAGKDEPEADKKPNIAITDPLSMVQTDDEYSVVSAPYCFGYQLAAQEFLEEVNEHIAKYGLISVADVRCLRNEPAEAEDDFIGWRSKISDQCITQGYSKQRGGSYFWINFPTPVKL